MLVVGTLSFIAGPHHAGAAEEPAFFVVTEGIVGGFVPPHVKFLAIVMQDGEGAKVVVRQQADRQAPVTFKQGKLTADQFKSLAESIAKAGVHSLPIESPRGSQDIYRADTSLHAHFGGKCWMNGGPGGCVHGESTVTAGEKDVQQFAAGVNAVKESAEKAATEEADLKAFQELYLTAMKLGCGQEKKGAPAPARAF